ncbi:MAG: lysophospholipid acyltransferase family protein [Saprospirales bacterium]|nr:lysophospholipid acyltransferase family protein [Saprospirales bacterium]
MMQFLEYLFFRLGVMLFAHLPFWLLFRLSDGMAFVLHRVLRYRKKIVLGNLQRSFPEKSEEELAAITNLFYRHLADILLEGMKGLFISKEEVLKRYRFVNPEVVNRFFYEGKHVFAMPAHYGNWEWGVLSFALQVEHQVIGVYKPIHNPLVERFMAERRTRFGLQLAPYYQTRQTMENLPATPALYIMMSDQSPSSHKKAQWVQFLNQETACLHGADFYARKLDCPVLYMDIQRVRRGYYEITFSELIERPSQTQEGAVTNAYMAKLESVIRAKPEDWLWSHRRWKSKMRPISADQ